MRKWELVVSAKVATVVGWSVAVVIGFVADSDVRGAEAKRSATARSESKFLLVGSHIIDRSQGVRPVLGKVEKDPHNPLFVEDKPWEVRFDNLYANVVFDRAEGIYKCWYNPFIVDEATANTPAEKRGAIPYMQALRGAKREMGICYATSRDGIRWAKPELGIIEFGGSKRNNLVMRHVHGTGVWKDLHDPDPARRYKGFMMDGVATSPDGLHWSEHLRCPGIEAAGDTHNNAFWDDRLSRYVGITRLWGDGQRIVGRTVSTDYRKWSKAVEVLRGNREHQTYAMITFPYANVYLGLVMVLHTKEDTVDCELAWSADTIRWQRVCPGVPLIPRGPAGSFDSHCLYAAAYPIVRDGEMRLYYGGGNARHGGWRATGFGLARMRVDGYAGMKTTEEDGIGTIVTKPIPCTGKRLRVNVDAPKGALRVGVLDAGGLGTENCRPITADVTDGIVTWQGGKDLAALKGKRIRLRFELKSATLYAFRFTE